MVQEMISALGIFEFANNGGKGRVGRAVYVVLSPSGKCLKVSNLCCVAGVYALSICSC